MALPLQLVDKANTIKVSGEPSLAPEAGLAQHDACLARLRAHRTQQSLRRCPSILPQPCARQ